MRPNSQDAVEEFRPYFDNAPVYGHGPSLEEFTAQTPLTVGSPQQVIERTLGFRDYVGDYQRQLFLIDHAGLPLKTVLEQLDLLGEEVVPVLRKEFAVGRPEHVPDAPTHESLVAAASRGRSAALEPERRRSSDDTWRSSAAGCGSRPRPGCWPTGSAQAVAAGAVPGRSSVSVSVIELRRLGRPIMDAMLTGFATSELEDAFEAVADADGLIAVTPAFNASFSGLFKSFFDVLPEETSADMPVLIAATGGTERHSLVLEHALRPMFSYLHAVVSPTGVYAATDDFGAAAARRAG